MISVVIGADRKNLKVTVKDQAGVVINVTGWTARLQGVSSSLQGATPLNVVGAIEGPAGDGTFKWAELGGTNFVTAAMIGERRSVVYECEIEYTDNLGKKDTGDQFQIEWRKALIA